MNSDIPGFALRRWPFLTDWAAEHLNGLFVITVCVKAKVTVKECGHANITSSQQGDDKSEPREKSESLNKHWLLRRGTEGLEEVKDGIR